VIDSEPTETPDKVLGQVFSTEDARKMLAPF